MWLTAQFEVLFKFLLLSEFYPLLGRSRFRGRCWAAIRLSHRPEPSGHAVHEEVDGLDIGGQYGRRFVLLRHTHRPQRRLYPIGTNRSSSSCLTLQRRLIFFCTLPLLVKATNLSNAAAHHACSPTPTKISIDILLPGGGCFLSISPCWPCIHIHRAYNVISAYLTVWWLLSCDFFIWSSLAQCFHNQFFRLNIRF